MTKIDKMELIEKVSLTTPEGTLNRRAVGWARNHMVDTSGIGAPRSRTNAPETNEGKSGARLKRIPKAWGRNKRWEYWNVMSPDFILALTVSNIDYATVNEVFVYNRQTGEKVGKTALSIPPRGVKLPPSLDEGPVRARGGGVEIAIDKTADGTRLRAKIEGVEFDVFAEKPDGHEALAVVVPWSDRRFQYTVKDVARPAHGWVKVGSETHAIVEGDSWAVLDHGRGRWPYDVTWNWGAGAGVSNGHTVGIQVGGKWTDGTGSTENSMTVDGRLHKISADLEWHYDVESWRTPWKIAGGGLNATFTPFFNKKSRTNFGVFVGNTDQCFGVWEGEFTPVGSSDTFAFAGIEGFAEHVHNRW